MVAVLQEHQSRWLSPSPLWQGFGGLTQPVDRIQFARPAILRFANDEFMDEYLSMLSYHPERLGEWLARNETWRKPMATPAATRELSIAEPVSALNQRMVRTAKSAGAMAVQQWTGPDEDGDLKLFQPAHQRFYLATASLVCRQAGLPERSVDSGKQESVNLVVRRLVHDDPDVVPVPGLAGTTEYAYVPGSDGPRWVPVSNPPAGSASTLVVGEQRLPMFSVMFNEDGDKIRKVLAGMIPVAKRENYITAPEDSSVPDLVSESVAGTLTDPRMVLFESDVSAPWKNLLEQARHERERLEAGVSLTGDFGDPPATANDAVLHTARNQIQTISWYVLIDLARFLQEHLPDLWNDIGGVTVALLDEELELKETFIDTSINVGLRNDLPAGPHAPIIADNLYAALALIADDEKIKLVNNAHVTIAERLEAVESSYDSDAPAAEWPDFLYPLADPAHNGPLPGIAVETTGEPGRSQAIVDEMAKLLEQAIVAANPNSGNIPTPATAVRPTFRTDRSPEQARFIVRCVYERPNCGPFSHPLVSEPSRVFEMASFFDADAPARPIRIPMPIDVSPAGLRKYAKNTSFMISDSLCGQMDRIKKFTLGDLVLSVLPWPFHKDLPDIGEPGPCRSGDNSPLGLYCSLSIPIVTLCALVLLFIMVALFDMIFRWLPLLFICFPLLAFKGKKK